MRERPGNIDRANHPIEVRPLHHAAKRDFLAGRAVGIDVVGRPQAQTNLELFDDAARVRLCQFAGGQVCGPFAFGPILLDVPQDFKEPLMLALSVPVRVHGEGDG